MAITKEAKQQFAGLAGVSTSVAQYWLNKFHGDLNAAIDGYFSKHPSLGSQTDSTGKNSTGYQDLSNIFNKYKDEESGKIDIDGTLRYLEDLGFDPEDPVALILAYTLDSPGTGVFLLDSFITRWSKEQVYTLDQMKAFLKSKRESLSSDEDYLKQVYKFTFGFVLETNQKKLSPDDAVLYWRLLLADQFPRETDLWVEFIETEYKRPVSRDAWEMLLLFFIAFKKDSKLENYDENAAWPSIIDEFVEFVKLNDKI